MEIPKRQTQTLDRMHLKEICDKNWNIHLKRVKSSNFVSFANNLLNVQLVKSQQITDFITDKYLFWAKKVPFLGGFGHLSLANIWTTVLCLVFWPTREFEPKYFFIFGEDVANSAVDSYLWGIP